MSEASVRGSPRMLTPPMRLAIPAEIELSHTTRNRADQVELKFKLASGGEVECRASRGYEAAHGPCQRSRG